MILTEQIKRLELRLAQLRPEQMEERREVARLLGWLNELETLKRLTHVNPVQVKPFWRFVHNVVAHPLMEVLPKNLGQWLHDETMPRAFTPVHAPEGVVALLYTLVVQYGITIQVLEEVIGDQEKQLATFPIIYGSKALELRIRSLARRLYDTLDWGHPRSKEIPMPTNALTLHADVRPRPPRDEGVETMQTELLVIALVLFAVGVVAMASSKDRHHAGLWIQSKQGRPLWDHPQ